MHGQSDVRPTVTFPAAGITATNRSDSNGILFQICFMIDTSFKTESPGTMQQVHTKFMLFLSIYRVAPKKLHIHQHSIPLELFKINTHTHTHTHLMALLSWTTRVRWYQKGKTNLDFTEARDSEWHRHQLGHMQVCTSLQVDNHASISTLSFFTGRMPFLPPNQQCQSTVQDKMKRISPELSYGF